MEFIDRYATAISALSSMLMAIIAVIMCITLYQNSKTIQINSEALELQKKDFRIRNRPIVDATKARFGGSLKSAEGYSFPNTVEIALKNLTDIPATNFRAHCKILIDNQVVRESKIEVGTLFQGTPWQGDVFLTKEIYENATSKSKRFSIDFTSTYSGILGEAPDEYSTSFILNYFPENKDFRFANKQFK